MSLDEQGGGGSAFEAIEHSAMAMPAVCMEV